MESEVSIFSQNIKYLRKKNNLKQEDLAAKLHLTSQGVSKWETGKSLPDITTLRSIGQLFDLSIEDLIGRVLEEDGEHPKEEKMVQQSSQARRRQKTQSTRKINLILSIG